MPPPPQPKFDLNQIQDDVVRLVERNTNIGNNITSWAKIISFVLTGLLTYLVYEHLRLDRVEENGKSDHSSITGYKETAIRHHNEASGICHFNSTSRNKPGISRDSYQAKATRKAARESYPPKTWEREVHR